MKIIQISDLHLVEPGATIHGIDPLRRLDAALAAVASGHGDAELVVFSGDLTDDGDASAYAALADRLARFPLPFRLMVGNHDDRAALAAAIPGLVPEGGFVQAAVDLPGGWRLVLADTLEPGQVAGRLCPERLGFIDAALDGAADALLFLHHPPFPIGVPSLDETRLVDADALGAVLARHGNVRHILAGHVHRAASGSWRGIPFTTARGTCHQSALVLDGPHAVSFEAPAYQVILAGAGGVVVHLEEFPAG